MQPAEDRDTGRRNRARAEGRPQSDRGGPRRRGQALHHPGHRLHLRAEGGDDQGRGSTGLDRCDPSPSGPAPPPCSSTSERRQTPGIEGVVLRYGQFYGPGTYYATDGNIAGQVRRRRFPIVGRGEGMFSFVHIDDAASATVASLELGAPGVYNVVDDEPAPLREWLPVYAEALGARRPLRVPVFLARLAAPLRPPSRPSSAAPQTPRRSASWTGAALSKLASRVSSSVG